jgi:hypothetical protein
MALEKNIGSNNFLLVRNKADQLLQKGLELKKIKLR